MSRLSAEGTITFEEFMRSFNKRLEKLEEIKKETTDDDFTIEGRLQYLEKHKNLQIDENRKISRRVDELQKALGILEMYIEGLRVYQVVERINDLRELVYKHGQMAGTIDANRGNKNPHKCPVCEGLMYVEDKEKTIGSRCNACEGKGIVWG